MNKISLAIAAATLSCASITTNAFDANVSEASFINYGTLTINISGHCKGSVKISNAELYTYNPLSSQSATIPLYDRNAETGEFLNHYGLVLTDASQNVIAAYAPARRAGNDIISNGIAVKKLTSSSNELKQTRKDDLTLTAAQDSVGAIDAVMSYVFANHTEKFSCKYVGDFDGLDESASTLTMSDNSGETRSKVSFKTQIKAKSVGNFISESSTGTEFAPPYTLQSHPFTISVSFAANHSYTKK